MASRFADLFGAGGFNALNREDRRQKRIQDREDRRNNRLQDRIGGIGDSIRDLLNDRQKSSNDPAPTPVATTEEEAVNPQLAAFENFYNQPVYQFPMQQGIDAINASWAGRNALESGAAAKSIGEYVGGVVAPGAFRDYMSYLGNQQGVGMGAASAQAGIGQGYANSIQAANTNYTNALSGANSAFANNATSLYGNYAANAAGAAGNLANAYSQGAINVGNINSNAAIAYANNSNSLVSGIGNALGTGAGIYAYYA